MHLGIDLGTSEVKALLLDEQHHIIAQAGNPLSVSRPHPLWAEQGPDDWWRATEDVIARLRNSVPPRSSSGAADENRRGILDRAGYCLERKLVVV